MANERSHLLKADELNRLRKQRGLSLDALARKANVHVKTLRRWLNGNPAFMQNVALLAEALKTTPESLIAAPEAKKHLDQRDIGLCLTLRVTGQLPAAESACIVERLTDGIRQVLLDLGIRPELVSAKIDLLQPIDGEKTRTIVFMWAQFESGNPAWVFVAVRPSRYQLFLTAHKAKLVDLYDFSAFGEIIVSGTELEDSLPPVHITTTVAHMFQLEDVATFLKKISECPWEES